MHVRLIKSCPLGLGKKGHGSRKKHCYVGNFRRRVEELATNERRAVIPERSRFSFP